MLKTLFIILSLIPCIIKTAEVKEAHFKAMSPKEFVTKSQNSEYEIYTQSCEDDQQRIHIIASSRDIKSGTIKTEECIVITRGTSYHSLDKSQQVCLFFKLKELYEKQQDAK